MELEHQRVAIVGQLTELTEDREPVLLHPGPAEVYAGMVQELQGTLADVVAGETHAQRQLIDSVRGLIEKIVVLPLTQDRHGPIDIILHGTLARFMSEGEQPENAGWGQW